MAKTPAELPGLGKRLDIIKPARDSIITAVLLIVLSSGFVTCGGTLALVSRGEPMVMCASIALAAFGLFAIIIAVIQISRSTEDLPPIGLYENGIVRYADKSEMVTIRWDDLAQFVYDPAPAGRKNPVRVYLPWTCHMALTDTNGATIDMSYRNLRQLKKLARRVWLIVEERILPAARARFQNGEDVICGRVTINMKGIQIGGLYRDWDAISRVSITRGSVVIQVLVDARPVDLVSMYASDVANLPVFLALMSTPDGPNKLASGVQSARKNLGL